MRFAEFIRKIEDKPPPIVKPKKVKPRLALAIGDAVQYRWSERDTDWSTYFGVVSWVDVSMSQARFRYMNLTGEIRESSTYNFNRYRRVEPSQVEHYNEIRNAVQVF